MEDHAALTRAFALNTIKAGYLESPAQLPMGWRPGARRLRVGYLSGDLQNHAVGVVIAELVERHDRERVEVFAYSMGPDDGSVQRERLRRGFEHFVDIAPLAIPATAERIRADGIDVLVDVTGWMSYGRVEALALRCAPVQASWLGFAGTLGHSRLADYVIGDAEVTPLSDQPYFTEKIAQMPHSYMPVDTTRAVGAAPPRASQGLPQDAFVLCSFNNSYKFNPPLFDLWCGLLRELPESVLWLPYHNDVVAANLRKEVSRRGVDPARLVLAARVDAVDAHLGRIQLADLALDTFPYNSHSTGVDALWAGVPLVAKRGDTFAGRVGASLLRAAGLPELVADDDAGYADLVRALYHDRARLAALRQRLHDAKATAPLFDMGRFARDIEDLYFAMAERAIVPAVAA